MNDLLNIARIRLEGALQRLDAATTDNLLDEQQRALAVMREVRDLFNQQGARA